MKVTVYEGTAEEIKELLPTIASSKEQININSKKISETIFQAIHDISQEDQEK